MQYVCKAIPGQGWRVWNRRTKRWWGNYFIEFPEALLAELNGEKRPEILVKLCRVAYGQRTKK